MRGHSADVADDGGGAVHHHHHGRVGDARDQDFPVLEAAFILRSRDDADFALRLTGRSAKTGERFFHE